jgi:hypothetical protein
MSEPETIFYLDVIRWGFELRQLGWRSIAELLVGSYRDYLRVFAGCEPVTADREVP